MQQLLHCTLGKVQSQLFLETGRGVLASSLQDMRSDISTLEKQHPELAQSFIDLRNQLDTPTGQGPVGASSTSIAASTQADPDQRHKASNEMDAHLEKIRCEPGFEGFLLPTSEDEMKKAAASGPIVIINVSSHRCDALIMEQSRTRVLELHQLSKQDILKRVKELQSLETLGWLWHSVVGPVLDALGLIEPPVGDTWPHMWWIPTGPLVRFPVHAAGYHASPGYKTTLDRVISSYSSSIKTILHNRQLQNHAIAVESPRDVVLVGMQSTPKLSSLTYAKSEIKAVRAVCDSIGLKYTQPEPPCQRDVLSALEACRIFHFAGHGMANPVDPLRSVLLLEDWHDRPLTVISPLETNLSSKLQFLAYLSACGTSQVLDDRSIDESINLTSAFQLAGFRHTIGTLWKVDDKLCVDMAEKTYEFIGKKGITDSSVSGGLHYATKALRDNWVQKRKRETK